MRTFTKEWLKASNDDLLTISKIKGDVHLTHIVAFHAQQSIEKSLKALLEESELEIPKVHKLLILCKKVDTSFFKYDEEIFEKLDELYIESRYPGDLGLLPNGKPTLKDAEIFFNQALDIFQSICKILNIDKKELL